MQGSRVSVDCRRAGAALAATLGLLLLGPGSAGALQFNPNGSERLHTLNSNQPGADWNTGGTQSGGELSFDANTGVATLTAAVDVLNWFDATPGSGCETDVGSNCSQNFGPDLAIILDAALVGIVPTPIPNTPFWNIRLDFQTTANALPDLVVTDPSDSNFGSVLEGNWTAGFFNSFPTTGLSVSLLFDTLTGTTVFETAGVSGFLAIDPASAYASLFESGQNFLGLNIATLGDFDDGVGGGLDAIAAVVFNTGQLPSFTAEANGEVFRLTSSDFVVPEPATALLVGLGVACLGMRRRS